MLRKLIPLTALLTLLIPLSLLFALDRSMTLGGPEGWEQIESTKGIAYRIGYQDRLAMTLADAQYEPGPTTDLLIHFNGERGAQPTDATGNYTVSSSRIAFDRERFVFGGGSGLFRGEHRALVLVPLSPSALFTPGRQWRDVTIEFWLYPANLDGEQTVLLWENGRYVDDAFLRQEMRASLVGGHLIWSFRNFFVPASMGRFNLTLSGSRFLLPRQWYHCVLRFDGDTGMVESSIDGRPDVIGYANAAGRENGTVDLPLMGSAQQPRLIVGDGYQGLLDELRISSAFIRNTESERFSLSPGVALSRIFDLGYPDTVVTAITAHMQTPGDTAVSFFYKAANELAGATELAGDWVQFAPGGELADPPKGRYLQLRIELLPDGAGRVAPALSSLTLTYRPHLPPTAPALLTARAGNGEITLSWRAVIDPDLAGYRIYYGDRPHQYFGSDSSSGPSPIDVGDRTTYTLKGLTNGRLYYLAVAAYDSSKPSEQGAFSREVAARPSELTGVTQ